MHFFSGHINKKDNLTSYNYFVRQNIHSWNYFAISRTWLAKLVTWQVWTAWLSQLTVTSINGSVWSNVMVSVLASC